VPVISRVGRRTWGRSLFHENERNYQERSKKKRNDNGTIKLKARSRTEQNVLKKVRTCPALLISHKFYF